MPEGSSSDAPVTRPGPRRPRILLAELVTEGVGWSFSKVGMTSRARCYPGGKSSSTNGCQDLTEEDQGRGRTEKLLQRKGHKRRAKAIRTKTPSTRNFPPKTI